MARDILELGADVFDDTVKPSKHRLSPKKKNYIIGLSIGGALLAGVITFGIIAANTFLLDYDNVENLIFTFPGENTLKEGEEQTATLYKLDSGITYPSTFRVPSSIKGYKVTNIADEAFKGHAEIKKVILPDTIQKIGRECFADCVNLETFSWSKNLSSIGKNAFDNTKFFNNFKTNDLCVIDSGMLIYCGKDYFKANTAITAKEMTSEEKSTYGVSNSYTFNELGIKYIMSGAFTDNDKLVYVQTPDNFTSIFASAFEGCYNLKEVDLSLSTNLTSIGEFGFYGCYSLKDVKFISQNITSIGDFAFSCSGLEEIPNFNNLKELGECIFMNCPNLKEVTFPLGFSEVGDGFFYGCEELDTIHWGDDANSGINDITYIGEDAFAGTAITSFDIPRNVSSICAGTFAECTKLTTIRLFDNRTNLIEEGSEEDGTFIGYDGLEHKGVPIGVSVIYEGAFEGCTNLNSFKLFDEEYVDHPDASASGTVYFPCTLKYMKSMTGLGNNNTFKGTNVSKLSLSRNLETIGDHDFEGLVNLSEVVVPTNSKLSTIGQYAFADCSSLLELHLPEKMKRVDEGAFKNCSNLTTLDMPNTGITSIESSLFEGCSKLEIVVISDTATIIKTKAFKGTTSLNEVEVPATVSVIESDAFIEERVSAPNFDEKLHIFINRKLSDTEMKSESPTALKLREGWRDDTAIEIYLIEGTSSDTPTEDEGTYVFEMNGSVRKIYQVVSGAYVEI